MKKIVSILLILIFILVGCSTVDEKKNEYTLPDLTNKTKEQVNTLLDSVPFTIIMKEIDNDMVDEGLFVEYGNGLQASDKVKYGDNVYIYFSKIKDNIVLPNLEGMDLNLIMTAMEDYNLDVNYQYVDSETITNNEFIEYGNDLEATDEVDDGASITIHISRQVISLPNLSGKTFNEVKSIMDNFDLQIEYNKIGTRDMENDLFMSYGNDLESGAKLYLTSPVVINISKYTGPIELPDLDGLDKIEILSTLSNYDFEVKFIQAIDDTVALGDFIKYRDFNVNDTIEQGTTLVIVISKGVDGTFSPIYLEYDGPRLDETYVDVNPIDPRGGFFEVTLNSCVDGDTAKFDYPYLVDQAIGNSNASTRFLNMDTEESTSKKEEWGKPASHYTCDMLTNAESIVLQTDPGDGLIDNPDYGRLLAWVWIIPEGTPLKTEEIDYTIDQYELLNYKIIQQGLAQVAYLYGAGEIKYNNITYTNWMYQAENYAQTNEIGQWGNLLDPYWDYEKDLPLGW